MVSPVLSRRQALSGNTAVKAPVTVVATSNVTQSGEQTIDGIALLASNAAGVPDRVLCTAQTDATTNGIWDVQTSAWTRSQDANATNDLANGSQVVVARGSAAKQVWVLTSSDPVVVGTSSQTWSQNLSAGFLATLAATGGAGLIGYAPTTSYSAGVGQYLNYLFGRTAAEITAGVTPTSYRYPEGDLRRYGGDASGSSDNSGAFNSAQAVSARVIFGEGTWKFTTAPTITRDDLTIWGYNPENTFINWTGAGTFLTLHGGYNHIEGVSLYGNGSSGGAYFTAGQVGVEIVGNLTMTRCQVRFWEKGLQQTVGSGFYLKFINCQFVYNKYHAYNLTANNTAFFGCKAAYSDYVVHCGGGDGPLSWIGGSIENVTTAAFVLVGGVTGTLNLTDVYIENSGGTSVAGTGLAAAGYKAAWLVLGNWPNVKATGCNGQIGGFQRIFDVTAATSPNLTSVGNQWTYKLDAGVTDTQYIYALADGCTALLMDRATGRSDPSYVVAASYTPTALFCSNPANIRGVDPISGADFAYAETTQTAATYTVLSSDVFLIANRAGTVTYTLPAASSNKGRRLHMRTITANAVASASSNVVPITGGAAGTSILAATAGKWAELVSDGTNWNIEKAG